MSLWGCQEGRKGCRDRNYFWRNLDGSWHLMVTALRLESSLASSSLASGAMDTARGAVTPNPLVQQIHWSWQCPSGPPRWPTLWWPPLRLPPLDPFHWAANCWSAASASADWMSPGDWTAMCACCSRTAIEKRIIRKNHSKVLILKT